LAVFNQKIQEIKRQRELSRDLLAGDKRRVLEMLEQECASTIKTAEAELLRILEDTVANTASIKLIEEALHKRLFCWVTSHYIVALGEKRSGWASRYRENPALSILMATSAKT